MHLGVYQGQHHNTMQASFLYSFGAESGIVGRSPPMISHTKPLLNCLSLNGGSPVAIKCIIIPKEYISDFFVNLPVSKISGAIKGKTPRIVTFRSCKFTD